MNPLDCVLIAFALIALLGVIFEELIQINKAKVVLFFGTLSWLLLFVTAAIRGNTQAVSEGLEKNISEIAGLWLFLVAAMTFVAYLNKKGLIENIVYLFLPPSIGEKKLLFLIAIFCFVLSSLADNITATLISMTLILSLNLNVQKMLRFAALSVFAVNSGGVSLITGDVTTLMIFLDRRVDIIDLLYLVIPAFLSVLLVASIFSIGLNGTVQIQRGIAPMRKIDIGIAVLFLITIVATIVLNAIFQVPPVLTFLFGLSTMFLIARFFSRDIEPDPILEYVRAIEFDTLLFFLGVLLLVGILKEIHALDSLVRIYDIFSPLTANYMMGILSSLVDNVPLTAAILKTEVTMDKAAWLTLTYAVGVGGSLFSIGSAAGIVAMSKIKGLTFISYARFSPILLLGFSAGFALVSLVGRWWLDTAV